MNTHYDSQWLIQVESVANELSRACNMSASGAMQRLALAVEEKELCSDLYLPVQKMWHGGQPESIETPVKEGAEQWRSIVKQSKAHHQSDKQKFDLPTSVSKYHVLASDLFEYSKRCSISSRAKDALRDLALRFNPELAAVSTATDGDAPAAKAGHGAQEQATAPRAAQAAPASEMKPEVATEAAQVAPLVTSNSAPVLQAKKRSDRKPSWSTVAMPYMRQLFAQGRYKSAAMFYKALVSKAGTEGSPFTKTSAGLFCEEAGTTVADGSVGKFWAEIRNG